MLYFPIFTFRYFLEEQILKTSKNRQHKKQRSLVEQFNIQASRNTIKPLKTKWYLEQGVKITV